MSKSSMKRSSPIGLRITLMSPIVLFILVLAVLNFCLWKNQKGWWQKQEVQKQDDYQHAGVAGCKARHDTDSAGLFEEGSKGLLILDGGDSLYIHHVQPLEIVTTPTYFFWLYNRSVLFCFLDGGVGRCELDKSVKSVALDPDRRGITIEWRD